MSEKDQQELFTRRAFILGGAQGLLLSSLVGRMYMLQVLSSEHYQTMSDKNRIHSRLTLPSRGQILDRTGQVLATNHNAYRAVIVRDQVFEVSAILDTIQDALGLSPQERERIERDLKKKPKFVPVTLKENLSWDEVARLELQLPELIGVSIEQGQNRYYPFPHETCHLLGYVSAPNEKELTGDPLLELPGFRIGKNGLEKNYDISLRGKPGVKQVEVNAYRRVVRELSTIESIPGNDLQLSVDLNLQKAVFNRLSQEESAAAIVMDVKTGKILSLVSTPGFDSNLFPNGISQKEWSHLLNHPRHVLNNKALSGQYAPGSTFKMIVALAALEEGVITNTTPVFCSGHVMLGSHKFHCHKKGGHGTVTLESAIAQSCDVYFYHIASLMGIDPIATMAKRFGLGAPTGIDIPGEKAGIVPSKSWSSLVMRRSWQLGQTYNASIGQGYVLATPLQLAVMTARLASRGKAVIPNCCTNTPVPEFEDMEINPKHLDWVLSGMNKVVNEPGGTAFMSRIKTAGQEMAGKTGTTQVRRISEKDRKLGLQNSSNRPWNTREHALFVGYAPLQNPRFATAVIIEHGGSGGKVAAPVGRDILIAAQSLIES
jgi:penicillin-binding protein 2